MNLVILYKALRPERKLITRKGKTFMTTVYVGSNKADREKQAKNMAIGKPVESKSPRSRSTTKLVKSHKKVIDYAPNDKVAVDKVLAFQNEYYKDHEEPSMYDAVQAATEEVKYALRKKGDSGKEWYGKSIDKTRAILAEKYPDLAGDTEWDFFVSILATLSAGVGPSTNLRTAVIAYDHYKKNGEIPVKNPETDKHFTTMSGPGMEKLKNLFNSFDSKQDYVAFMNDVSSAGHLRENYGADVTGYAANLTGGADEAAFNSMVMGEKVGQFYHSIRGTEGSVTVDRWAIRSFYRWTGQLEEGVTSDTHGNPMRVINDKVSAENRRGAEYVMQTVADKLGLKSYEVQAVLWFYEKRLYNKLGIPRTGKDEDFGTVAEELFKKSMGDFDIQQTIFDLASKGTLPTFRGVLRAIMSVKKG